MIEFIIPGRNNLLIKNIVFDYNGTIALDGKISEDIKKELIALSKFLDIYVLTADTHGNVTNECRGLPIEVEISEKGNTTFFKKEFITKIGSSSTIAVGNGLNDMEMLKESTLSIAVIGEEGCSVKSLMNADIVVKDVKDVFMMLHKKERIVATLRD